MDRMNEENPKPKTGDGDLPPKWAEDFPIDMLQDIQIARRDFIRFLFLVSLGLFTGTGGIFIKSMMDRHASDRPFRILGPDDIEVGGSYVFKLPDELGPGILVRLSKNEYVAYSQKCTHLQCPVIWQSGGSKLFCPCHHGAFDAKTGAVLYGPPERPLPRVKLGVRPDGIFFEGMESVA